MMRRKWMMGAALLLCLAIPVSAAAGSAGTGMASEGDASSKAQSVSVSEMADGLTMRASSVLDEEKASEVTRGEFITMLAEASGDDLSLYKGKESPFEDVDSSGSAGNAVIWAYDKWIVNGNSDGSFRPDGKITRQEAAAILGRYIDYRFTALPAGCGTGSPDKSNIAEWARNGVSKCWMYGVIEVGSEPIASDSGVVSSSPDFHPRDYVTAAEAKKWVENVNAMDMSAIAPAQDKTFADSLAAELGKEKGNWSISPYSVQMCLAMLANGAKGDTQKELLASLKIDDLEKYNEDTKTILEKYDGYARIMSLETANSMWLNQSWFDGKGAFLTDFSRKMNQIFGAEVKEVINSNSVEQVNAWVKEKTKEKIPTILTEDHREFVTALLNAVYFKAAWEKEFPESLTEKGMFTNADGSTSEVEFMHQTGNFGYYSTPGIQAVKMDYRKYAADNEMGDNYEYFPDADFSMYLIKADDGQADLQNILDNAQFESVPVKLTMPKFKVEYGAKLNDALKALGVKTAFDRQKADLSGIIDPASLPMGQYFVGDVLHKTYIAVDEKGTEAAAVTAVIGGTTSAPPERDPLVREFTADEPFYFIIRDNASGQILFAGQYETAKSA